MNSGDTLALSSNVKMMFYCDSTLLWIKMFVKKKRPARGHKSSCLSKSASINKGRHFL